MNSEEIPNRSITLLLRERYVLSDPEIDRLLSHALNINSDMLDTEQDWCTPVIEGAQYMLKVNGIAMILHNRVSQYFENPNAIAECIISDPEIVEYVHNHKAWLSVGSLGSDLGKAQEYTALFRIITQFFNEDVVAMFIPEYETIIRLDRSRRQLLIDNPKLETMGYKI